MKKRIHNVRIGNEESLIGDRAKLKVFARAQGMFSFFYVLNF